MDLAQGELPCEMRKETCKQRLEAKINREWLRVFYIRHMSDVSHESIPLGSAAGPVSFNGSMADAMTKHHNVNCSNNSSIVSVYPPSYQATSLLATEKQATEKRPVL
jgi:hypothetical protein